MRLIDADAYLECVKPKGIADELWKESETYLSIMRMPPVDAVPVVRCKDCKFYYQMTAETGICELACRHLGNDGFCSEGERKDGDGK